jgi:glycerol-3-phosphate dehydrogenase subunit C
MGAKAAEMLRLIPETKIDIVERCSGHGGTFGVLKPTHAIAMKVGEPTARLAVEQKNARLVSDCPLAGKHLVQVMRERIEGGTSAPARAAHPIELIAESYGLSPEH